MNNSALLDKCASFEHRGPAQASLTELEGHRVHVHRRETDWADVVLGRPVTDNRTSDLADLYPSARQMLSEVMRGLTEASQMANGPSSKPPGMR